MSDGLRLVDFSIPGRKLGLVAIKPNLNYYWDSDSGETTSVPLVAATIDVIREEMKASEIILVETDATSMKAATAFKVLGYEKLAKEKKVELVNMSRLDYEEVDLDSIPLVKDLPPLRIPSIYRSIDLFVSIPKLKVHPLPELSCSLKNQFGCIYDRKKSVYHELCLKGKCRCKAFLKWKVGPALCEAIAVVNKYFLPNIIVVDGLIAKGRTPKRLNLIMTGTDPVAVDSVAAKIMGMKNPRQIRVAESLGVGTSQAEVLGRLESYVSRFPRKNLTYNLKISFLMGAYDTYLRFLTLEGHLPHSLSSVPWER